jgi:hypothetical protein
MNTMTTVRPQDTFDRAAERAAAVPAGYLYNAAEYGPAIWTTLEPQVRFGSPSFIFRGSDITQVSSPAVAARVCALLTAGAPALEAEYARRARKAFLHAEIRRRERIKTLALRALRNSELARALNLRERVVTLQRTIDVQRELLDPTSATSLAMNVTRAALHERMATFRAAHGHETLPVSSATQTT